MAFAYMFANLAVGVGTALRSENVRNVENSTQMKEPKMTQNKSSKG